MISVTRSPGNPTFEQVAEHIVWLLWRQRWLSRPPQPPSWDAFLRLSDLIHRQFEVPSTTLTPMMRRLLFALAGAAQPRVIVGVGTYVGYAFSWLLGDRADVDAARLFDHAEGIDVDVEANEVARRNCQVLGHGERLRFHDGDGVAVLAGSKGPIDLLYLDVDAPGTGKRTYLDLLEASQSRLRSGALVLAHDPCVPAFRDDFRFYHAYIEESEAFDGPMVLPVDSCGLSVASARPGEVRCDHDIDDAGEP